MSTLPPRPEPTAPFGHHSCRQLRHRHRATVKRPHRHLLPPCRRSCSFWCMPQGERTPAEKVEFVHMLQNINVLYLSLSVLILLDLSYISRFWCAHTRRGQKEHTITGASAGAGDGAGAPTMGGLHGALRRLHSVLG